MASRRANFSMIVAGIVPLTSRAMVVRLFSLSLAGALALVLALAPVAFADENPAAPAPEAAQQEEHEEFDPLFDDPDEELEEEPPGFPDPAEATNRNVHIFNGFVDTWLLDPITYAYGWVPNPIKNAVRRFFSNLGEPATTVNNVLQLEWKDAGVSSSRFVINSTVGLVGLFDVAEHVGLEYHRSDFGQTLALAGTPSGPYLMLPIFGPNNVRDGFGNLADITMHPLTWFLGPTNFLIYGLYGGSQGLSVREQNIEKLDALKDGSVDYYAALRNAYYQNRVAEIWVRREHRKNDWDAR
jgi:phospholipid-binding lipoprotein MlaA